MKLEWREFREDGTVEHVARLPFSAGLVPFCWGDMALELSACVIATGPENDRSYYTMARIDSESGNTQVLITNPLQEEACFTEEQAAKTNAIKLLLSSVETMIASLEALKADPDKVEWKRNVDGKYNTLETHVLLLEAFALYGKREDKNLELSAWAFPRKEEKKFTPSVVLCTESNTIKQLLTDPAECALYDKEEDAVQDAAGKLMALAEAILRNLYSAEEILKSEI